MSEVAVTVQQVWYYPSNSTYSTWETPKTAPPLVCDNRFEPAACRIQSKGVNYDTTAVVM